MVSFCGVIIIMPWGQVVVGPPGCGKTTYCAGMANLLSLLGRKTIVVNLDPANDTLPYTAAVDIAKVNEHPHFHTFPHPFHPGSLMYFVI